MKLFSQTIRPATRLGCLIVTGVSLAFARSSQASDPAPASGADTNNVPTYLRDVRPILMGNCSRCHNQSTHYVYNWLDYQTAYADRWEIKRRLWDSWDGKYYKEQMPVENSPESLSISEADRLTIKRWVESGALIGTTPPPTAFTKAERMQAGKKLFNSICAACHQAGGQGRANVFPPLANSDYLNSDKTRAIQLVIFGRQGDVVVNGMKYNNNMPSFPLSDDDIANVLTYVYNSFGNSGLEVKPDEVKALRASPPKVESTPAKKSDFE